jgi:hypothetical protein
VASEKETDRILFYYYLKRSLSKRTIGLKLPVGKQLNTVKRLLLQNENMGPKTRVGVLLRESVARKTGHTSADLMSLKDRYVKFSKQLQSLILALSSHMKAMEQISATRQNVSYFIIF